MRYYAKYSNGVLVCVGTGLGGEEITEKQYHTIRAEIFEKSRYTDLVCNGEISIDDVPAQWKADIEHRVSENNVDELSVEGVSADIATDEDYEAALAEFGVEV